MESIAPEERTAALLDQFSFEADSPEDVGKKPSDILNGALSNPSVGVFILDLSQASSERFLQEISATCPDGIEGRLVCSTEEAPVYILRLNLSQGGREDDEIALHELSHLFWKLLRTSEFTLPYEHTPDLAISEEAAREAFTFFQDELIAYISGNPNIQFESIDTGTDLLYSDDLELLLIGNRVKTQLAVCLNRLRGEGRPPHNLIYSIMKSKSFKELLGNIRLM